MLVALVGCVDAFAPSSSMWFPVLRKVCTFALAAVAMNLLNGFTGLFSLGQAGFMLLGAYAYAILTIPVELRSTVFRNYGDSLVQFQMPLVLALLAEELLSPAFLASRTAWISFLAPRVRDWAFSQKASGSIWSYTSLVFTP